jgi:hypothetical protein
MQLALGKTGPIVVQMALAMLALAVVAFVPPAYGRMLLVPLDGKPVSPATIGELEATPLKPGPLPGSWVVEGDREKLSGLWGQWVLVLAAPAALCASG